MMGWDTTGKPGGTIRGSHGDLFDGTDPYDGEGAANYNTDARRNGPPIRQEDCGQEILFQKITTINNVATNQGWGLGDSPTSASGSYSTTTMGSRGQEDAGDD